MDKLKTLEIKKLLKELDYIESDFEYRSEVISEADSEFIKCVNSFLDAHPELKEIYDQKITDQINRTIKEKVDISIKNEEEAIEVEEAEKEFIDSGDDIVVESDKIIETISPKLKKLYREIVKLTHPDKVKKKKLNDIYIKATDYYNLNDKIGIYKICSDLDIYYEIEIEDGDFISNKIDSYKKKIGFMESTFTWRWYRTENENEKNQILINYIKLRIQ